MTGGFRLKAGAALLAAVALMAGAAVAAAAEGYDQKFRDEFMRSCISGGGSYTVCQCSMQRIERRLLNVTPVDWDRSRGRRP